MFFTISTIRSILFTCPTRNNTDEKGLSIIYLCNYKISKLFRRKFLCSKRKHIGQRRVCIKCHPEKKSRC